MKVVCVKRGKIKNLTEEKVYEVTKVRTGTHMDSLIDYKNFVVINDAGIEKSYSASRFITIEQMREVKLTNIGI
jgi:hypothetical protein